MAASTMTRGLVFVPFLAVLLAILLPQRQGLPLREPLPGRNNTVLFITSDASGLSNVHLAAASALVEKHPSIEVHYASFNEMEQKISRISKAVTSKNPKAEPITWHSVPGKGSIAVVLSEWKNFDRMITPPGFAGLRKLMQDWGTIGAPWDGPTHLAIYTRMKEIVEKVDPAIIVFDSVLKPASDLVLNLDRRFTYLSPNTVVEIFSSDQPRGAGFWKYPALGSGYPFPLPWNMVPLNILFQARLIWGLLTNARVTSVQKYLKVHGVKDPIQPTFGHSQADALMCTTPEVSFPMDTIPQGTKFFGPVVLDTAPAAEQDPEMAAWLRQMPTVLINLGSMLQYSKERTEAMVGALHIVLQARDNVQVLWKFRKAGNYSDQVFDSLRPYVDNGRLRIETWIQADPMSLMLTGDIVVSVHHGGANCYHEALLAGVPQVVLPLWFDLYNMGRTVEYLGVGLWPGKETAPNWEPETLAEGFLKTLSGDAADSMRVKAKEFQKITQSYGGRYAAAEEIARRAALGASTAKVQD